MRLDGIGDALICAPLVAALRDAGHMLGALLTTRNRDAFAPRAFSRVHAVERVPWPRHGSTPASRRAALAELCAVEYDLALIVSEELEAYRLADAAAIPQRVGFVNGWEKPLKTLQVRGLLTHEVLRPASASRVLEHEVESVFRLGKDLHDESAPTRDPARLRPLLLEGEPPRHGRVVVQLSRKFAAQGLDAAAFAAVTRALAEAGHAPLCLADDAAFAADVVARGGLASEHPVSLGAWKATLAGARAVVTPDSGAAHVAGMLGVPCVSIFPAVVNAARDVLRWRPWCGPERSLVASELAVPYGVLQERFAERVASELDDLLHEAA